METLTLSDGDGQPLVITPTSAPSTQIFDPAVIRLVGVKTLKTIRIRDKALHTVEQDLIVTEILVF